MVAARCTPCRGLRTSAACEVCPDPTSGVALVCTAVLRTAGRGALEESPLSESTDLHTIEEDLALEARRRALGIPELEAEEEAIAGQIRALRSRARACWCS